MFQEGLKRGKAAANDLLSNRINDKVNYLDGSVSLFRKSASKNLHSSYTHSIEFYL